MTTTRQEYPMADFPILDTARICHEANRTIQHLLGDPVPSPPWDGAPQWQRDSTVTGVIAARDGATPEELHDHWRAQKIDDGWTYGEVKDPDARTHPCLVDYSELPAGQRAKDAVFHAIVTALSDPPTPTRDPDAAARHDRATARFFTASEQPAVVALREQIIGLGELIDLHVPPGRNQSLALTALEDVQMRGNRGIFAPEGLR